MTDEEREAAIREMLAVCKGDVLLSLRSISESWEQAFAAAIEQRNRLLATLDEARTRAEGAEAERDDARSIVERQKYHLNDQHKQLCEAASSFERLSREIAAARAGSAKCCAECGAVAPNAHDPDCKTPTHRDWYRDDKEPTRV
jgi:chromosome segregation ATPase